MIAAAISVALVGAGVATGLECLAHGRYVELVGALCAIGIGLALLA